MKLQVPYNVGSVALLWICASSQATEQEGFYYRCVHYTVDVWITPWALLAYCKTGKYNEQNV